MQQKKKMLFGGALFSAGLMVGAAPQTAQADWTFTDGLINYGRGAATDNYGGYALQQFVSYGPNPFTDVAISGDGLSITANADSSYVGFTHSSDSSLWVASYAAVGAYVTASSDQLLLAEWDFAGHSLGLNSYVQVIDVTNGWVDLLFSGDQAGSETVSLVEGNVYFLRGRSSNFADTAGGDAFSSFTAAVIPLPGALAMLGVAGVTATTRRRRE